uniref:Glycine-rich domain-containing protein n=1 Tax=viral metagenome TaxID=1070528 RepID=A0A6C0K3N6_9ZZZZ
MAKSFSNPTFYNSGKSAFGNAFNTDDSGDYTRNKKAKLLYRHNFNGFNFGGVLGSQNNYLLFQRAKVIRNETCESCPSLTSFNPSDLVAGLYTNEKLGGTIDGAKWGVNVVTDATFNEGPPCVLVSTNIQGANIYPKNATTPFYWKYKIDPCGSLFGNAPCGYDNYEDYRVISKPVVTTASSLKDCCVAACFTENILQEGLCNEVCAYNNAPRFSYTVTGSPTITIINGFTVLTFTTSGSFQFQNVNKNIGYIVVGGGGAGSGGNNTGNGGGGGGGGAAVAYITTNSQSVSLNITYTITIGTGGLGASNATGGSGSNSSISGISSASGGNGGLVGVGGTQGLGGVTGSGGGTGGNGYNNSPISQATNGSNGSTVATNYGINYLLSSGGGGGDSNRAGQPGTSFGGGAAGVPAGSGGEPGISATYYGCGGGASSGDGRGGAGGPYTGGNGAPGVVIVWFSS